MKEYLDLAKRVLDNGVLRINRTETKTYSTFGEFFKYTFRDDEIPLLTTKTMSFESVLSELLWFIEGSTNERRLAEIRYGKDRSELNEKNTIWTPNFNKQAKVLGYKDGELGPIYGKQWRSWLSFNPKGSNAMNGSTPVTYLTESFDQMKNVINEIKKNPSSRRLVVNSWNVGELSLMALPPCHLMYQFYVHFNEHGNPYGLSLQWTQRSADVFLGVPYNIASYAVLLRIVCKLTGLKPVSLSASFGDIHIYENHMDALKEQLNRTPLEFPVLKIRDGIELDNLTMEDFRLIGYKSQGAIKAKMIA